LLGRRKKKGAGWNGGRVGGRERRVRSGGMRIIREYLV
jgi:hypothetical protein